MKPLVCLSLFISGSLLIFSAAAQNDNDANSPFSDDGAHVGRLVFNVEHSFGNDDYKLRTQVTILNLKNKIGVVSPSVPLTTDEQKRFRSLAESKGIYRIRIPTPGKASEYVSTIAPACGLLETGLKDILVLTLDNNGNLLGVADMVPVGTCGGSYNWLTPQDFEFNTTLEIRTIEPGPVPETASYIQKLEQEKQAKERGEGKDNRSFLGKYWIYIVIVVLFVMMSGANNSEQGSGGGGEGG